MAMYVGAAAIAAGTQQRVRRRKPNLVRTACGSMEDVCLSSWSQSLNLR